MNSLKKRLVVVVSGLAIALIMGALGSGVDLGSPSDNGSTGSQDVNEQPMAGYSDGHGGG